MLFSVLTKTILFLCNDMLFAVAVLDFVSSLLSQEIGWEEHFENDLFFS